MRKIKFITQFKCNCKREQSEHHIQKLGAALRLLLLFILAISLPSCVVDFNRHNIENWHKLRAIGEASMVKHNYAAAQKSFAEALKIVEPINKEPVRLAISLEELSTVCLETNDMQLANNIFNESLALANKRCQTPAKQLDVLESELGDCFINVARVFTKGNKHDQAAIAYREARALFIDVCKNSPPQLNNFIAGSYLACSIDGLGTSYKELGQLKEARQAYFSLADYNIIRGLSDELKQKLLTDFCAIPDTAKEDKEKYATMLGCSL